MMNTFCHVKVKFLQYKIYNAFHLLYAIIFL